MRPSATTLKYLVNLVATRVISEKTVVLYLYYCTSGNASPLRSEIQAGTGFTLATIRTHDKVLEALDLISHSKQAIRGKGALVTVSDVKRPSTPPPSSITSILNIASQKDTYKRYMNSKGSLGSNNSNTTLLGRREGCARLSSWDIAHDVDFLEAKRQLLLHFKEFEIDPSQLLKKNRFSLLVDLLQEDGFDFGKYCKWYADTKYRDKGFNFGLFLYPRMIAEFRYHLEVVATDNRYLKTKSALADSDNFKTGVSRTKEFLSALEDEDET